MPRYQVRVVQRIMHVYTKTFDAKTKAQARRWAEAEVNNGMEADNEWVERVNDSEVLGEEITEVTLEKK